MTPKSTQKSNALLLALWGFCLFGFGVYVFELGRFIVPLSWALGWHLTALAFGNALLKGVGYEPDGLPTRLTWSWLLGLGTFGFVVFILFLLGFGQTGVLWALWGLAASTGLWGLWSVNKDDGFAGRLPTHWFGFGLAGCLVILFAMSPPLFYDTAVYHLGLMEQMGLWEQTLHFPHSSFASMPLITEMAIAVPFWLSGDPVVFNVANSFGFLLLGAAVSTVARAHFPKADNAGLLLAVLACPIVIFVTTGGKPDWMTATAFAGALYFWIVLVQHPESSHGPWLLLGLALGIMIGSKYHGLLFAVIFCGAALSNC